MAINDFLNDLNKEVGYKFGTPWRYSDKALGVIVPILKIGDDRLPGKGFEEREYITLEEAKDQGVVFKDSGRIDRVIIESSLGKPIFIRSGTALKSKGTQSRAVEKSVIIMPGVQKADVKEQEIEVRCIYASKPISRGTKFSYGGDVPIEVRSALISRSGQGKTWGAVESVTHRFMSNRLVSNNVHHFSAPRRHGLHDDLIGAMEDVDKFTPNIDEILKKVPLFEDQVGAVFLDMKDVIGMEMFDHPKSWESIHREVEKRLGESVAKEEDQSFFKPDYEKVKPLTLEFLKKLLESDKTEMSHGPISTVYLKGNGIIGEATTINGKVIHLVGMRVDESR